DPARRRGRRAHRRARLPPRRLSRADRLDRARHGRRGRGALPAPARAAATAEKPPVVPPQPEGAMMAPVRTLPRVHRPPRFAVLPPPARPEPAGGEPFEAGPGEGLTGAGQLAHPVLQFEEPPERPAVEALAAERQPRHPGPAG